MFRTKSNERIKWNHGINGQIKGGNQTMVTKNFGMTKINILENADHILNNLPSQPHFYFHLEK